MYRAEPETVGFSGAWVASLVDVDGWCHLGRVDSDTAKMENGSIQAKEVTRLGLEC